MLRFRWVTMRFRSASSWFPSLLFLFLPLDPDHLNLFRKFHLLNQVRVRDSRCARVRVRVRVRVGVSVSVSVSVGVSVSVRVIII